MSAKTESRRKKILIFSLEYFPSVGGAEVAVKEITDRIPDIDFEMVTMLSDPELPLEEEVGNVLVHRIPTSKMLFPMEAYLYARKLQTEKSFDAVWSIMAAFAGFAATFFKMSFPEVPYILTLQEGNPIASMRRKAAFVSPLHQRVFRKADAIQAISHYLADYARLMGYKGEVEVVPNGVDTKSYEKKDDDSDRHETRKTLGISEDDVLLVTTSRLEKKNAIGSVVNAMHFMPESVKFLIIGSGTLEDRLKDKVANQNLMDRVIFLGGIPHKDVPEYLHASDIFIRPSLSEGFGNSFIEAMAAGLPVIATPVGGIVDFLRDGETGVFCEVNDPRSIADSVKRLMDNPDLRESIKRNAQEMVKEKYDWNLVARQMWQVFTSAFERQEDK